MMGLPKKHLIYGALTFVSLAGAMLKVIAGLSPAWTFYLGVMYVTFLVWAIGQLREISAKEAASDADSFESGREVAPLPPDRRPSEETLITAETYLSIGESLDTVCMAIEPRYRDWDNAEKLAYRQGLRAAIDERKADSSEAAGA